MEIPIGKILCDEHNNSYRIEWDKYADPVHKLEFIHEFFDIASEEYKKALDELREEAQDARRDLKEMNS